MEHLPVLLNEVIEYLNPQPGENFMDCTFGFGGHSAAILEKISPGGKVLGIEIDKDVYELVKSKPGTENGYGTLGTGQGLSPDCPQSAIAERLMLVNGSYVNLKKIAGEKKFGPVNGVLMDLGFSSWHIEKSKRGFSFQKDEPLDMRYDKNFQFSNSNGSGLLTTYGFQTTAGEIINKWKENDIIKILREYGEERFAGRIAKEIAEQRKKEPIKTTFQLVEIIKKAIPKRFQFGAIHPATRTFQALRIAVNDELENLKQGLESAFEVLENNGRLVVISFQSLEDKIVKNYFRDLKMQGLAEVLTKKPVIASLKEIATNPRARSAKLRALRKVNI